MIKPLILGLMLSTIVTHSVIASENSYFSSLSLSGSTGLTTDYRFRGLSQSRNDPSVHGALTLTHNSGWSVGIFAANVDFGSATSPNFEFSSFIGYNTELNWFEQLKPTLDLSFNRYSYPGWSDWAWNELSARLIFDTVFLSKDHLVTNLNYANDYAGFAGNAWNLNLGYSVPFAETGFGLISNVGYSAIKNKGALIDANADRYVDWKIGLNYGFRAFEGLTAELSAVGTNLDTNTLTRSEKRTVSNGAIFSLTKAF